MLQIGHRFRMKRNDRRAKKCQRDFHPGDILSPEPQILLTRHLGNHSDIKCLIKSEDLSTPGLNRPEILPAGNDHHREMALTAGKEKLCQCPDSR